MRFRKLSKDDRGVSAAEYAILLALVGSALALASIALGGSIADAMNNSGDCVQQHGKSCGKGNAHQPKPDHPDHPDHPPHPTK